MRIGPFCWVGVALLAPVLLAGASGCSAPAVEPDLGSDRPSEIVPALIEQSRRGENADYAALVLSLDHEDPAIRLFAAETLEELTGQTFGYRYYQDRHERRPAVDRWRAWLDGDAETTDAAVQAADAIPPTPVTRRRPEPSHEP